MMDMQSIQSFWSVKSRLLSRHGKLILAIAVEGVLYCFDMGAGLDSGWTINAGNSAYTNSVAPAAI
ncbi:MAG TPA: hypothetical protein PKO35_04425 [Candidatus Atribacteria bacterium]|nr:hypothetical protein [Candidatus Atribacteria bacterium]